MTSKFTDAEREYMAAHVPAPQRRATKSATVKFRHLGVRVQNGTVSKNEFLGDELGPLAGASAEIIDGTQVHNIAAAAITLMPIIALTKRTKGACAVVVIPGKNKPFVRKLSDRKAVAAAKIDAIQFNALAAAAR